MIRSHVARIRAAGWQGMIDELPRWAGAGAGQSSRRHQPVLVASWWCRDCGVGWADPERVPCWRCGESDALVVVEL
jgi:hypothetical protein